MAVLAHGVGTRGDLPVPVELAAIAAGAVLVGTFVLLGALWKTPRFGPVRPFPRPPGWLRAGLRAVVTGAALAVVVVGFAGPDDPARNLAPWVLYIWFWVGIVPVSLLCGPVWRLVNPLRALHAGLAAVLRVDPERGVADLSPRVGLWPAAAALLAFCWLELAAPAPSDPRTVAWFLTGYAVVQLAAGLVFGRRWFAHGDGFEVWSTLLGSMAPVRRNPLAGLESVRPEPGLTGVVLVLVGGTAFDGLSRSALWLADGPATLGLLGAVAVVTGLYLLGTRRPDPVRGADRPSVPAAFAHTLVPIAAGYAIAHYFSLLMFDGQQVLVLLGLRAGVDYTWLGVGVIAAVQLGAIVLGHVVAAVAAHERAVRLYPPAVALRIQYPVLASMVILTCGAVALVLAP